MLKCATIAAAAVAGASAASWEGWMGDNAEQLAGMTLRDMTLPGTHDSGAYWLGSQLNPDAAPEMLEELIAVAEKLGVPIEDIITPWGEAQSVDFYEQCAGGVRYFDLRAGWNGTEWLTHHTEFGFPVQTLVSDVARFLAEQPTEVAVVEVSHLDGSPPSAEVEALAAMLEDTFGALLLPSASGLGATYGDMVSAGQRALVTMEGGVAAAHPLLWDPSAIHNTYADSDDLATMEAYNYARVAEFEAGSWEDSLYKVSWTLTPQAKTIVDMVLPGHPKSLQQLADTAAAPLVDFVDAQLADGNRTGNILIIDHFQTSEVVELCIEMTLSS